MAHSLSSKKRIRQNARRRQINRTRKGSLKTQIRKFEDAVHDKDLAVADQELVKVTKALDRSAARGSLHRNKAARKKSRLQLRINKLKSSAT